MRNLFIFLLSALSLTAVAQQKIEPSRIPDWFMEPSENTYIGISAPNAIEQDAINMALLQLLLTHDSYAFKCRDLINEVSAGTQDHFQSQIEQNCDILIDTIVNYSILNISRLNSGEYICSLTDGSTHTSHIQLMLKSTMTAMYIDGDETTMIANEFMFQFEESKYYIMNYVNGETSVSRNIRKKDFSFAYVSESPGIHTVYKSPLFSDKEQIHYLFPTASKKEHLNASSEFISIMDNRSLYEKMIDAYWNILYNGFTSIDNKKYIEQTESGIVYLMRKATPILGFSYDDGILEIQYKL